MNRKEKLEQIERRLEKIEARIIEFEELNNELQAISGHSAQELVQLFKTGYTLTSPREAYEHCFRHKHWNNLKHLCPVEKEAAKIRDLSFKLSLGGV